MVYLHRYSTNDDGDESVEIAVVEEARHAERYEARGFIRCTPEAFRVAWRLRDQQSLAHIRESLGIEQERAVGEPSSYRSLG
ncbi:MAG TPA: hypothetical protein VKB96_01380 [Gammaproteobacteria bacterium]|nr:hypothetical protein [Gammaproteobacteria bacterium]